MRSAAVILVACGAVASACIFDFPDVTLQGQGGAGGGQGGLGGVGAQGGAGGEGGEAGQGGMDGGGGQILIGCGEGTPSIVAPIRPDNSTDASVALSAAHEDANGLLVGGSFISGMFLGGDLVAPANPFSGHGFVMRIDQGTQTLVGYTKECGAPSAGFPYLGRHMAFLDSDPVMTGDYGLIPAIPGPASIVGFGVPDPCDAQTRTNDTGMSNLTPYVVRYDVQNVGNPLVTVDQGPRNSVSVGLAANGDRVAILGMSYTPAWDYAGTPPGKSGRSWYVTRFDSSLALEEPGPATQMFGDPAYDTANPEADGGDIAIADDGELWVTGRNCPDGTGCRLFVRGGTNFTWLLSIGAPEPADSRSKGTAIAVFGNTVLVGITVEGSITVSDGMGGNQTLTAAAGEFDSWVIAIDRSRQALLWAVPIGGVDFDEPRSIAVADDTCGGTVYVVGCSAGDLDCNPYDPGNDPTRAFVVALSLQDGVQRWRKDYESVAGNQALPLFANAEDVSVGDDELYVSLSFAGGLQDLDGGSFLPVQSSDAAGINLRTGAVLRLGLE